MDIIRHLLSAIFLVRWVALTDFRGEVRVRRIRYRGGEPYAQWMSYGIRPVGLLPNGALSGGAYVESWRPYDPAAKNKLPEWSADNPNV